jgi:hypothetical protein
MEHGAREAQRRRARRGEAGLGHGAAQPRGCCEREGRRRSCEVVVWRDTKLRCGAAQSQWEGMVVEEGIRGGLYEPLTRGSFTVVLTSSLAF